MNKKKFKVLYIVDDEMFRELFGAKFKQAGFEFVTFSDASGTLVERAAEIQPDIISLDIFMPGRDGYEALQLLKSNKRTKNIPIIVACNLNGSEDIQRSLKLGAVDHLVMAKYTPVEMVKIFSTYLADPKSYIPSGSKR